MIITFGFFVIKKNIYSYEILIANELSKFYNIDIDILEYILKNIRIIPPNNDILSNIHYIDQKVNKLIYICVQYYDKIQTLISKMYKIKEYILILKSKNYILNHLNVKSRTIETKEIIINHYPEIKNIAITLNDCIEPYIIYDDIFKILTINRKNYTYIQFIFDVMNMNNNNIEYLKNNISYISSKESFVSKDIV